MFLYRRTLGVLLGFWLTVPACAFTFSYGNLLDVKDVQNGGGVLVLPQTNKKYTNVKVLSKKVYDFLGQCRTDCAYPVQDAAFTVVDFRKASTREDMLIADVDINEEILLTFLIFKNKKGHSVKTPQPVVFKDKKLEKQIVFRLNNLAEETL